MLAKLFGSKLRAKIIGWFFTHPGEEYYVRQVASLIGADGKNVSLELKRLEELGILSSTAKGNQKYYRVDEGCAIRGELTGIAVRTFGLAGVLKETLRGFGGGVRLALIFGSVASGEFEAASDVDLLVVGTVDGVKLGRALRRAEKRIGRRINDVHLSPDEYRDRRKNGDAFLEKIFARGKITISGSPDDY